MPRIDALEAPISDNREVVTQTNERTEVGEYRNRVPHLLGGVNHRIVRVQSNPRRTRRKTCMIRGIPLDGSARVIAAHRAQTVEDALGIISVFDGHTVVVGGLNVLKVLDSREDRVCHAQFFTLVDVGGSA